MGKNRQIEDDYLNNSIAALRMEFLDSYRILRENENEYSRART